MQVHRICRSSCAVKDLECKALVRLKSGVVLASLVLEGFTLSCLFCHIFAFFVLERIARTVFFSVFLPRQVHETISEAVAKIGNMGFGLVQRGAMPLLQKLII